MTTAENPSLIAQLDSRAGVRASGGCPGFLWKTINRNLLMISVVTLALAASAPASWGGHRIVLLHERDAAKLRHTKQEWPNVPHPRNLSIGPLIVVEKPKVIDGANGPTIEVANPVDINVLFQPRSTPVDMDSLDIEARKGFFSKSLTPMLKPYIHGTALQVQNAEIPPGRFVLEISIADQAGNTSTQTYRLEIVQP